MQPVICLIGPTASGKTALAFALADRYPVHLISVDSAQIYRGMNIGSAKPDAATLARYPHALIDILEPEEPYSAGRFAADARREIAAAHARGQIPLLVGGTMLYYHTLYTGLDDLPPADPENRARIERASPPLAVLRCTPNSPAPTRKAPPLSSRTTASAWYARSNCLPPPASRRVRSTPRNKPAARRGRHSPSASTRHAPCYTNALASAFTR